MAIAWKWFHLARFPGDSRGIAASILCVSFLTFSGGGCRSYKEGVEPLLQNYSLTITASKFCKPCHEGGFEDCKTRGRAGVPFVFWKCIAQGFSGFLQDGETRFCLEACGVAVVLRDFVRGRIRLASLVGLLCCKRSKFTAFNSKKSERNRWYCRPLHCSGSGQYSP